MSAPRLSAVVITRDEERCLRTCLESLRWADELVVVDAESTDATVRIAREFTQRVVVRSWPGFAGQKNFAVAQATGDWVLSVDADEEVSAELREEIGGLLAAAPTHAAYAVPRRNLFLGAWVRHGGLYPDWQVRLFRRAAGTFTSRAVHEALAVRGTVGRLRGPLVHRSWAGIDDFLARSHRYASLAAEEWIAEGRRVRRADLVLRPLGRFLGMYVLRRGFLDGWRGLLLAELYAYYVLMRSAKVLERSGW